MDLSDHVILDKDTFLKLQTDAWDSPPATFADRAAATAQTTAMFAAFAGAFVLGAWGVARVQEWREEKRFQRRQREHPSQPPIQ